MYTPAFISSGDETPSEKPQACGTEGYIEEEWRHRRPAARKPQCRGTRRRRLRVGAAGRRRSLEGEAAEIARRGYGEAQRAPT